MPTGHSAGQPGGTGDAATEPIAGLSPGTTLLVAGAAALPPVYVTIIRETRANRTPWRPSYLYAVGALGPVAGMVLNPLVGGSGLSLDAIAYVVLPVGAVVGLPVSAFVLPRIKRFVRRIRWRLSS